MECVPIKKIAKSCHKVYLSVLESGAYHIQCKLMIKSLIIILKHTVTQPFDILSRSTTGTVMS